MLLSEWTAWVAIGATASALVSAILTRGKIALRKKDPDRATQYECWANVTQFLTVAIAMGGIAVAWAKIEDERKSKERMASVVDNLGRVTEDERRSSGKLTVVVDNLGRVVEKLTPRQLGNDTDEDKAAFVAALSPHASNGNLTIWANPDQTRFAKGIFELALRAHWNASMAASIIPLDEDGVAVMVQPSSTSYEDMDTATFLVKALKDGGVSDVTGPAISKWPDSRTNKIALRIGRK